MTKKIEGRTLRRSPRSIGINRDGFSAACGSPAASFKRGPQQHVAVTPDEEMPFANSPDNKLLGPPAKKARQARHTVPDQMLSSALVESTCYKGAKTTMTYTFADECQLVVEELGKLHPEVLEDCLIRRQKAQKGDGFSNSIMDGLVTTILSQNTTNANSTRAFQRLKQTFPTWEQVLKESPTRLEEAIRCGGLAEIKSKRIHGILKTLQAERGSPSLEYLRKLSNDEIKRELGRFPGLGPKTISCLLLFTMGRPEFPVDTHVHRIAKSNLKWTPSRASREEAYEQLNVAVPPNLKLELHCLLIAHGRQCHRCAARGKPQFPPKDGTKIKCPLINIAAVAASNIRFDTTDAAPDKAMSAPPHIVIKKAC